MDWQIASCLGNDLQAAQAQLQRYYDAALSAARRRDAEAAEWGVEPGLRPQEAANLVQTQEAWEAYSELVCQSGEYQRSAGGTIQPVMYLACLVSMTKQRTHTIWVDHLAGFDDTALPEPLVAALQ